MQAMPLQSSSVSSCLLETAAQICDVRAGAPCHANHVRCACAALMYLNVNHSPPFWVSHSPPAMLSCVTEAEPFSRRAPPPRQWGPGAGSRPCKGARCRPGPHRRGNGDSSAWLRLRRSSARLLGNARAPGRTLTIAARCAAELLLEPQLSVGVRWNIE